MLLLAAVAIVVATALMVAMPSPFRRRLRPIVCAAAATAPVATVLLVLRSGTDVGLGERALTLLLVLVPTFVACVIAVVILGVPLSLALDRFGYTSRLAYILSGVALVLLGGGSALLYDWCCVATGPFMLSFAERVSLFGAQRVAQQYLLFGASAALCAGIAANVYWSSRLPNAAYNSLERSCDR